jgi:hypothetical protein
MPAGAWQGPDQSAYRLAFGIVSRHTYEASEYSMRILMLHVKDVHHLYAARNWSF